MTSLLAGSRTLSPGPPGYPGQACAASSTCARRSDVAAESDRVVIRKDFRRRNTMSIIEAYLRLVARWRWSFLLALLTGSFVLLAIVPDGAITRLTGFTLFMLVFGGALYT